MIAMGMIRDHAVDHLSILHLSFPRVSPVHSAITFVRSTRQPVRCQIGCERSWRHICVRKCGMRRCTWAALPKPAAEGILNPMTAELADLPCRLVLQSWCNAAMRTPTEEVSCRSHQIVPLSIPFPFRLSHPSRVLG